MLLFAFQNFNKNQGGFAMDAKTAKPHKAALRKEKEAREILRLEKARARPRGPGYLYYLLLIISVVYIADEVASQIGTQMQSVLAQAIFAPVYGPENAVARMSAWGALTYLGMGAAFLFKPLADRYGRKPFLVINTLGMGAGLLFISVATNIPVYLLGALTIALFIPHDMQTVYIMECTPAKHRAKIYFVIKAIATLGMMLIPVLRGAFMGADITKWRLVFVVPMIIAIGAAIFSLIFARETDAFIAQRLEFLRRGDGEREKKGENVEQAQGGFIPAMKFSLSNRQMRWLIIGSGLLSFGMLMTMYYETTMTYGFAQRFLEQGMALEQAKASAAPFVTQALYLFPVGSAALQLVQGFMADKWGRKLTVAIMSVCCVAAFVLFFVGVRQGWSPWLVGLLCGGAIGGYWAAGDISGAVMCAESTPTNLRSSVLAVRILFSGLFTGACMGAGILLVNTFGDAYAGIISVVFAVPGTIAGIVLLLVKARETKDVVLETVTGKE